MKAVRYKFEDNYFTKIDSIKIYVDNTNKRVKIIDINNISSVENLKRIIHFSSRQHLGKVICYCDSKTYKYFDEAKFELEGKIDGYFKGKDAFCMSYFIDRNRKKCNGVCSKNLLVKQCLDIKGTFIKQDKNFSYCIRNANENDIEEMTDLFAVVFSTYPSPVYDEEYLRETMKEKVLYKVATYNEKIISIASADMNKENLNAEITDCATYLNYRGKGILSNIIYSLECDLKNMGFITLYSLSRALVPGINIALSKHDYKYTGRLVNNCNMCDAFEDMNIWVKKISNSVSAE